MPFISHRSLILPAVLLLQAFTFGAPEAHAVSREVREACRRDYLNLCNTFEVGSPQLRQCMRRNQRRLSDRCVSALISSGEATPGERARAKISRRNKPTDGQSRSSRY